ncbi:MAG: hypothetical protein AB8G05_24945 [Oligoflexales bacterium]
MLNKMSFVLGIILILIGVVGCGKDTFRQVSKDSSAATSENLEAKADGANQNQEEANSSTTIKDDKDSKDEGDDEEDEKKSEHTNGTIINVDSADELNDSIMLSSWIRLGDKMEDGGLFTPTDEKNDDCATGQLDAPEQHKLLTPGLHVLETSAFKITLTEICGVDYEGARIELLDNNGDVVIGSDIPVGTSEFKFPPDIVTDNGATTESAIFLTKGVYSLKINAGVKNYFLNKDTDAYSIGSVVMDYYGSVNVSYD